MADIANHPRWLKNATDKLGITEIAGSKHNPTIIGWLKILGAWWSNDEEPWCGTFVAICLKEAGLPIIKHWYRAREWATYGKEVTPRVGSLLVFSRSGGGHVGWYIAEAMRTINGKSVLCYLVRGGNQSNKVCDTWIEASRMIACRWPEGVPVTTQSVVMNSATGEISTNEA